MTGTKVSLAVTEGAAWITLDGPERRNALDAQAARDLAAICDTIEADPAAGVAVITGTGRAFCSGADTAILNRIRTASPDQAYDGLDEMYAGFRRFAELSAAVRSMVAHLAADPVLARALAADLHRTVHDPGAWDRAVEIERARQMWSLARNPKES
jgi:enoyl-CoA hydratase